jgi:hypothetical protein
MAEPSILALVRRLEHSICILEAVAQKFNDPKASTAPLPAAPVQEVSAVADDSPMIVAFGKYQDTFLANYVNLSEKIGSLVAEQVVSLRLFNLGKPRKGCLWSPQHSAEDCFEISKACY